MMTIALVAGYAALIVLMSLVWVIAMRRSNAAVVDVAWGGGFVLFALVAATLGGAPTPRTWLLAGMIILWSGRLALHLLRDRVLAGHPEDERYREIRARWKTHLPLKFFFFFQLQGFMIAALSVPFAWVMMNPAPGLSWVEWSGVILWAAALLGESAADRQLASFKADPANKGKVCRSGLWRWSRHPNYFFEWCVWIALFVFALPSPLGWTAVAGPVVMYVVLTRMTGIPLTEEHALRSRGEAYRAYQRTTSAFVPWFPREEQR
jgi:steroid 5-alpha reductase family enzyme